MIHRSARGSELMNSSVEEQEEELRDFLNQGNSQVDAMNTIVNELKNKGNELDEIRNRLKTIVSWGHPLAMNDSPEYLLNTQINQCYVNSVKFNPIDFVHNLTR